MEQAKLNRNECLFCKKQYTKPLFRFPKDHVKLWLKIIEKEDLLKSMQYTYIYNNARLCSLHFKDCSFTSTLKNKLHKFAVPCLEKDADEVPSASSKESSSLQRTNCGLEESTNISSSQIQQKSKTDMLSSETGALSVNKMPIVISSSQIVGTSSNKVSENKSVVAVMSSPKTNATVLKVFKKAPTLKTSSSQIQQNSKTNMLSSETGALPVHKMSTVMPSSQTGGTSLNKVSENKSVVTIMPSPKTNATVLNKVFEKAPTLKRSVSSLTIDITKDPSLTLVTLCCTESKEGIAFHKFLLDPKQRMRWISTVKCKDLKPSHICILCPKHYIEDQANQTLKENETPNLILDPLRQQENAGLSQEVTTEDEISKLLGLPEEKKFYVKVLWDDSATKIAEKMSLKIGAVTNNDSARKKLKRDEVCSNNTNPNNQSNLPIQLPEKDSEEQLNHTDADEGLRKDKIDSSSDTNPSLPISYPQPANESVNSVDFNKNLQDTTIHSSCDMNDSDLPNLSVNLPEIVNEKLNNIASKTSLQKDTSSSGDNSSSKLQTSANLPQETNEEPINHSDGGGLLKKKDVVPNSSDINQNNHTKRPISLPLKAEKQLVKHVKVKFKKDTINSLDSVKNGNLVQSAKYLLLKRIDIDPLSSNKEKIHLVSPSIATDGKNLIDSYTQTISDSVSNVIEEEMNSSKSDCDTRKERKTNVAHTESTTQTESAELQPSNSVNVDVEKEVSSDTEMEGRTDVTHFPKIVNVVGGIDPFDIQQNTEVNKQLSYDCPEKIKVPNEWWGTTSTPKFIICTKWNESYDPIFKVIVENYSNVKIFVKGRECVNENRKVSLDDISVLLEEVDSYQICAGIGDKSMTECMGYLESGPEKPFSIWCKGCQRKGKEIINRYKLQQELQ